MIYLFFKFYIHSFYQLILIKIFYHFILFNTHPFTILRSYVLLILIIL